MLAAVAPIGRRSRRAVDRHDDDHRGDDNGTGDDDDRHHDDDHDDDAAAPPRPQPKPKLLPLGVTIGGIHVGGLSPTARYTVVRAAFRAPLVLQAGGHRAMVSPATLGAIAYAKAAVAHARSARRRRRGPARR